MENTENKEINSEEINKEEINKEEKSESSAENAEGPLMVVMDDSDIKPAEKNSSILNDVTDVLETVLLCMFIFLMVRSFVFDQAIVDGPSMVPTLHDKEKIIYQKIYSPKDYDIVIVDNDKLGPLVKRVVATEGEEIDIREGNVYVNGVQLDEQIYAEGASLTAKHFVSSPTTVSYKPFIPEEDYPITVPEGCLFVMGDNRIVSNDSRSQDVGFVKESEVVGKVLLRYSPLKDFKLLW